MLPAKNGPIYFERREPPKCSGVLFSPQKTLPVVTQIDGEGNRQRLCDSVVRSTGNPGFCLQRAG